ncbi:MAG: NADH-quinone oxidoreductase subunit NuoG [Chloroflexota bacterium]|nr:NADH-quinone oxidoreductase subunit NuoG [Chloroflexota bacterium]
MAKEQELVTIYVDGQEVKAPKGVMLVEAAKVVDVNIPVFCYHPKIEPVGMCRMCLVEIGNPSKNKEGELELDEEGNPVIKWMPKLVTACTTPISEGMHVKTNTTRVADAWRGTLEFLLTSHPLDCPVCDKGGECPLQDLTFAYGPDLSRFYKRNKYQFVKPIPLGELIWLDRERCIYCARCIRFQEEIADDPVLMFADRNRGQEIVTYSDPPFDSYFSGNTTDVCPVGALTTEDFRFRARPWELTNVPSIDIYDCVGSNIVLGTRSNDIKRIMPRQNEWVNELWISDKTRFGHHFVRAEDRLATPLIKENGEFRPATWKEALRLIADRLAEVMASRGSDAIGAIAGDRAGNEDLYLFAKFIREVIGTNNIDFRLHWPTNTGIEEAIRSVGLTSGSNLGEVGSGTVILTFGADLEEEQPVLYLRVRGATKQGAKLYVVQSRTTKEMGDATESLIVKPGSEAHLAAALLKAVMSKGEPDFGKLGGADELQAGVDALDAEELATQTGMEAETIDSLAEVITGAESLIVMVGREAVLNAGDNASALVDALAALLVATGKAGEENSGLVALWPHNNSQGAADMGALPHFAAGYDKVDSPGATMDEMLSGKAGLRAAYVLASDPAQERPDSIEVLQNLDFLVVHELFMTKTAELADVVLPAAAFAERDGTFTNFARRVQRYEKGVEPVGEALPDWKIITYLAALFDAEWPDYFTAHDVAQEIAKKVKPYKGMTYEKLRGEAVGWTTTAAGHHIYSGTSIMNSWYGQQWSTESESRRPKFDLHWHDLQPVRSVEDGQFNLILQRKLYDDGTMIRRSHLLDQRRAEPFVKLSPIDAGSIEAVEGDMVVVTSDAGQVTVPLRVDPTLQPGVAVVPVGVDGLSVGTLATKGISVASIVRSVVEVV